jgi:hypothetical protein
MFVQETVPVKTVLWIPVPVPVPSHVSRRQSPSEYNQCEPGVNVVPSSSNRLKTPLTGAAGFTDAHSFERAVTAEVPASVIALMCGVRVVDGFGWL